MLRQAPPGRARVPDARNVVVICKVAGDRLRLELEDGRVLQSEPVPLERWTTIVSNHDSDGRVSLYVNGRAMALTEAPAPR